MHLASPSVCFAAHWWVFACLVCGQALNKIGKPDFFLEEDVYLMQAFCNEVAVALKRKSVETALSKVTADRGSSRDRVRGKCRARARARAPCTDGGGEVECCHTLCSAAPTV